METNNQIYIRPILEKDIMTMALHETKEAVINVVNNCGATGSNFAIYDVHLNKLNFVMENF